MEEVTQTGHQQRPTTDQIAACAARGRMPDAALTAYEWLLWYELRDVYNDFRSGAATKEDGEKRKQNAINRFDRLTAKDEEDRKTVFRCAELWRKMESAAAEYRKAPSLETADKVMNIIYGIL